MSTNTRRSFAITFAALSIAALATVGWFADRAGAVPTGTISGRVTHINGDPDVVIPMSADPVCLSLHAEPVHTEQVVVDGEGNLANVLVYVKEGVKGRFPAPAEAAVLSQEGCLYSPHVAAVVKGQTLVIRNSDPTLHNVHGRPSLNKEFNIGQPFQGMETSRTFDKAEIGIPIGCDIHPWMSSYISVLEHPFFAVTGPDGTFTLAGLPPGDYVIEAWHERLGTRSLQAQVAGDESREADFSFGE